MGNKGCFIVTMQRDRKVKILASYISVDQGNLVCMDDDRQIIEIIAAGEWVRVRKDDDQQRPAEG